MKLLLIKWADSFGVSPTWASLSSIKERVVPLIATSVGFEAYRDKAVVVLVPHVTPETDCCEGQGCGEMTIPISAIISEDELIVGGNLRHEGRIHDDLDDNLEPHKTDSFEPPSQFPVTDQSSTPMPTTVKPLPCDTPSDSRDVKLFFNNGCSAPGCYFDGVYCYTGKRAEAMKEKGADLGIPSDCVSHWEEIREEFDFSESAP